MRGAATIAVGFLVLAGLCTSAGAGHSLVDRVKDGPAAPIIRESFEYFEKGEAADDDEVKVGFYERGTELAKEALAVEPNNAEAQFAHFANWGRRLQTEGWLRNAHRLPAVWRELDRTLELDPNHSPALGAKGGLYLKLPGFLGGDIDKAEPLLRRAVELDAHAVGARLELAECYQEMGRKNAARDLAARALELATEQDKPRFVTRAKELLEDLGGSRDRVARSGDR